MQNSLREGDKEITLSYKKTEKAILELDFLISSLDKIGSCYIDKKRELCAEELLHFIEKSDVLDRLSYLRGVLIKEYDKARGLDESLFEAEENQVCWEKPGDYSTEKWLKDEDVFKEPSQVKERRC